MPVHYSQLLFYFIFYIYNIQNDFLCCTLLCDYELQYYSFTVLVIYSVDNSVFFFCTHELLFRVLLYV